jgi:hypothetical protein
MTHWMAATIAVCLSFCCAQRIGAQSAAAPSTELSVNAGVVQGASRDLSASPLNFDGMGGLLAITYHHDGRTALEFSAVGGARALRSSSAGSLATEHVGQGQAELALLRSLLDERARYNVAVGGALTGNLALTEHAYADPSHRVADFVFGSSGIGPAASLRTRVGRGMFSTRLIIPVAAVVEHSYSVVNEHDAATDRRFVTLKDFRAATATVSYASNAQRRFALSYLYRIDLLRYDDVQPVRAMTQSFSVGIATRFGSATGAP